MGRIGARPARASASASRTAGSKPVAGFFRPTMTSALVAVADSRYAVTPSQRALRSLIVDGVSSSEASRASRIPPGRSHGRTARKRAASPMSPRRRAGVTVPRRTAGQRTSRLTSSWETRASSRSQTRTREKCVAAWLATGRRGSMPYRIAVEPAVRLARNRPSPQGAATAANGASGRLSSRPSRSPAPAGIAAGLARMEDGRAM